MSARTIDKFRAGAGVACPRNARAHTVQTELERSNYKSLMRVVILGAGASYGASDYHVARPPLVDQFFAVASQHRLLEQSFAARSVESLRKELARHGSDFGQVAAILGGPWEGHISGLKAFIAEQLNVQEQDLATTPINIERLFGLIEAALLGRVGYDRLHNTTPQRSYEDVLEQQLYLVICGSLIASTRGVRCGYHRAIAEWLNPGDVVVSFNYDLLADRALADRGDWWINDGYGHRFHRVGKWSGAHGEWRFPLETESRVKLLKPHGSLNWLYCRDPKESNLHVSLKGGVARPPAEVLYCLEDMHEDFEADWPVFEWWARYEYEDVTDEYSFDLHSLIIPPAITKHYRDYEVFVGSTWARALDALLTDAEELYFVGYSLRPEDLRSWWLFRTAASEAERLRWVRVIDPSPVAYHRIRSVFDGRNVEHVADDIGASRMHYHEYGYVRP